MHIPLMITNEKLDACPLLTNGKNRLPYAGILNHIFAATLVLFISLFFTLLLHDHSLQFYRHLRHETRKLWSGDTLGRWVYIVLHIYAYVHATIGGSAPV